LGRTGGARGIAQRREVVLVDRGGPVQLRPGGHQVLVVQHPGVAVRPVRGDDDEVPAPGPDLVDQREQRPVGDDDAVLGVLDDVGDLRRLQAEVDGVQHRASQRDREVELEVPVVFQASVATRSAGRTPRRTNAPASRTTRAWYSR